MADSPISGLTAGTVAEADEFPFVQSGVTKRDTIQGIIDLVPSSSNLGSANLTADANERKYILNGALSSNKLTIESSAGTDVMSIMGNNAVSVPTGYFGVNTTNLGPGFGGYRATIVGGASSRALSISANQANSSAIYISNAHTASSGYGVWVNSINTASVNKVGFRADIRNGSTNLALDILNGDIQFGTGTGTKIGIATNQKFSFWGATPVVQQVLATGASATVDDVISMLQTLGICKQS